MQEAFALIGVWLKQPWRKNEQLNLIQRENRNFILTQIFFCRRGMGNLTLFLVTKGSGMVLVGSQSES
jgi:hypothetical protein